MSKEECGRLFDRFLQANRRTASEYGGSGLGLAISKKLVELMGGSIQVKSQKWYGSEFSFTIRCLQLTAEEKLQILKTQKRNEKFETLSFAITGKHVLIVEDNKLNQTILGNFLKQQGCFYQFANNGLQALEQCAKFNFDLIFMDIEMPIMDGLEATQKIRQQEQTTGIHIPIVGLSGNARAVQMDIALRAGMDDYMTKPYHRQDIYQMIARYTSPAGFAASNMSSASGAAASSSSSSTTQRLLQAAIARFKAELELLLQQRYPLRAIQRDNQIIFQLLATNTSLTQHACRLILKEIQGAVKSCDELCHIRESLLTSENLILTTQSNEQAQRLQVFFKEAGLEDAFTTSTIAEEARSVSHTAVPFFNG